MATVKLISNYQKVGREEGGNLPFFGWDAWYQRITRNGFMLLGILGLFIHASSEIEFLKAVCGGGVCRRFGRENNTKQKGPTSDIAMRTPIDPITCTLTTQIYTIILLSLLLDIYTIHGWFQWFCCCFESHIFREKTHHSISPDRALMALTKTTDTRITAHSNASLAAAFGQCFRKTCPCFSLG